VEFKVVGRKVGLREEKHPHASGVSLGPEPRSGKEEGPGRLNGRQGRYTGKRCFDLLVAASGLVLLSPLFIIFSLLIKTTGKGPVFSFQEKMGRRFRPFLLYSFQTRAQPPEGASLESRSRAYQRRTKFGRFLRRWKLDELPQLINVLKGEMSIVGPRPEDRKRVESFRDEYEEILVVSPGMIVCRDPEYVQRASLRLDSKILFNAVASFVVGSLLPLIRKSLEWIVACASPYRRLLVVSAHGGLVILSAYLSLLIRFEGEIPAVQRAYLPYSLPVLFAIRMIGFAPFGLFSGLWRYASASDLRNIACSVILSSLVFFLVNHYLLEFSAFPRSVILIDTLLLGVLLSAIRLTKRILCSISAPRVGETRILIIGAGDGGEGILREMERHPAYGYRPVGFVDDELTKRGTRIRGVRVLGTRKDLERIIREQSPDEILVAIPSAPLEVMREIVRDCRKFGLPVKTMSGIQDILSTRVLLEKIKDVEPEDLLCRPPVTAESPKLRGFFRGRAVMVTGAGGSIGSELVRQLGCFGPSALILYERHEHSLYQMDMELRRTYPDLNLVPVIGDILDTHRVYQVLKEHEPKVLFHAAAYKHVPLMELHPREAIRVNVLGTRNVAQLAMDSGIDRFVFISSDKAVEPYSVMGSTKRVAELMLQDYAGKSSTKFMTVRFGNVLESSGSVLPLFKEQIKRGGPVTVTHPDVTRYFMTTTEAVHLVLHAAIMGKGGEIFVLDMGDPIRVLEMAKQLISLYGYEPDRDIKIEITGLRAGEKLHEGLFNPGEKVNSTGHQKIRMAVNGYKQDDLLKSEQFLFLEEVISNGADLSEIREKLLAVIGREKEKDKI